MSECLIAVVLAFNLSLDRLDVLTHSNYQNKDVVALMIGVESAWNPDAVSPAGAVGLMQVMPATAKLVMKAGKEAGCSLPSVPYNLKDPTTSVQLGTCLLRILHKKYEGDLIKVWLDYHGGPRAVYQFTSHSINRVNPATRDYVLRLARLYMNCVDKLGKQCYTKPEGG